MQRTIDKASQAAQNADRTRRAERGQNPPRRTRTEPAPATTPSSRPHASVQCSAQRTRLRASRAYLVRSPRKYTELRSRVGEVASSSPRGPLRGRAEREQNPTRRTRPRRLAPVPSAVTPSRGSPPRQIQKPSPARRAVLPHGPPLSNHPPPPGLALALAQPDGAQRVGCLCEGWPGFGEERATDHRPRPNKARPARLRSRAERSPRRKMLKVRSGEAKPGPTIDLPRRVRAGPLPPPRETKPSPTRRAAPAVRQPVHLL